MGAVAAVKPGLPGVIVHVYLAGFAPADLAVGAGHAGGRYKVAVQRLNVGSVAPADAGMGLIPVGYPLRPFVLQCGDFLIGGVIAALAGIIGFPADLGAGGSLGLVMRQVVIIRVDGQLLIGGVIAVLAGLIGIPAWLGAGGRFAIVGDQRMADR